MIIFVTNCAYVCAIKLFGMPDEFSIYPITKENYFNLRHRNPNNLPSKRTSVDT